MVKGKGESGKGEGERGKDERGEGERGKMKGANDFIFFGKPNTN